MEFLERLNQLLNQTLIWIAGIFLGAMVLLSCANILLRIVWVPLPGTFELLAYFSAIVTAFALGYTQMARGHIAVDILLQRFPLRMRRVLGAVSALACLVLFGLASWQIAVYAATLWRTGEVTETLRIIYYPFTFGVSLGCATLALVFLTDFLRLIIRKEVEPQ